MKNPKSPHSFLLSLFGFFAVVRGYNIALLIAAQYLTFTYILAPHWPLLSVVLDPRLFALVLATAFSTAAGFIINNFYDAEKDRINRPQKYLLEHLISLKSQLLLYFLLNAVALIAAGFVSFKALLFFGFFILAIWPTAAALNGCFGSATLSPRPWWFFPFLPSPFILKTLGC